MRVGDDPAARLDIGLAALEQDRTDGDAESEVAGEIEVADGPGIQAPPRWLELVDDLHRANLWRARHGAGRETRYQRIEPVASFGELSFDHRHHVHDVRVTL